MEFTAHGFKRSFTHDFMEGMEQHAAGGHVRVLFDPASPRNAALDQGPAKFTPVFVGAVVFLVIVIADLLGF